MERQTGSLKTNLRCDQCDQFRPVTMTQTGVLEPGDCPTCKTSTPRATAAEVLPRVTGS